MPVNGPAAEEEGEKMVTTTSDSEVSSVNKGEDILALQDLDPALNAKMHLVNNVSECGGPRPRPRLGSAFGGDVMKTHERI